MEDDLKFSPHQKLVDMFEEAEQANLTATDVALRCRDYFNGNQLTEEELSALSKRGQPPQIFNYIRSEVNWLRGWEMQQRTDPKAFPREPNADAGAEAATDAVRFVCDKEKWARKRSDCWENMLIEGMCGVEIIHKFQPPMNEPEICINRYSFDRLFADPHSTEPDYSDARYKGAVIWSDMDELKRKYPDKEDIIEASIGPNDVSTDVFEDKPYHTIWTDPKRRRARCVLIHWIEDGKWMWAKFVKGGVLEGGESPYVDEDKRSVCPLIMHSAYVDRENGRHGVVKDMLYPQDGVNKRHSKLLHQMNSRQTWGVKGAVGSVKAMKRELASPDGHVEVTQEAAMDARDTGVLPFNIIPQADQVAGQAQLLQESKSEIMRQGANGALAGKDSKGTSGRAIMAEQQGGMVEIAPIVDRLSNFTVDVYEAIWQRIRQFWTAPKWIRVTDDEANARFVGLNQQVTLQDKLAEMPREQVVMIARQMGLSPNDPRLSQVVEVRNQVEQINVDMVLEEVPDSVTLEGETFEQIVNIATSMPGSMPPEILIETAPNLDRKMKEKLLEALQKAQSAQQQGHQMQAKLQGSKVQAEIQKDNATAAKTVADAQKTQVETMQMAQGLR